MSGTIGLFEARAWVAKQCGLAKKKGDEDLIPSGVQTLEKFGIDSFFAFSKGDEVPASWHERAELLEDMLNVFHPENEKFIFLGLADHEQFLVVESSGPASVVVVPVASLAF
ncbi:MAG: hypothetical protein Q7S50_03000 [bacterium]|nr:hypothetical protein [bacterium]